MRLVNSISRQKNLFVEKSLRKSLQKSCGGGSISLKDNSVIVSCTNVNPVFVQYLSQARCDERPTNRNKVDHANRLGKDLAGKPNSPSDKVISEELEPFNERWRDINAKLESSTDKGYPDNNNDCCIIKHFKRKFKSMKSS